MALLVMQIRSLYFDCLIIYKNLNQMNHKYSNLCFIKISQYDKLSVQDQLHRTHEGVIVQFQIILAILTHCTSNIDLSLIRPDCKNHQIELPKDISFLGTQSNIHTHKP